MYDEMTTSDLIASAYDEAHPDHEPCAENAALVDELARRLSKLDVWRQRMIAAVDLIENAACSAQDWSGTHLGDSLDAAKSLANEQADTRHE